MKLFISNDSKVRDYFKKAIKLQPEYIEAHLTLGKIQTKRGCLEEAINSYRQLLKINPEN